MSFDLQLEHFAAGESAPIDPAPIAAVLARRRHTRPDDFGVCAVEFDDGTRVEFNAGGLDSREPFRGCAFHIRGTSAALLAFIHEVARAGDFVIFKAQGDDSAESPVVNRALHLTRPACRLSPTTSL